MVTVQGGLFERPSIFWDIASHRLVIIPYMLVVVMGSVFVVLRYQILSGEQPKVFAFRARVLILCPYSYRTYVVTKQTGNYSFYAKYLAVCLFFD